MSHTDLILLSILVSVTIGLHRIANAINNKQPDTTKPEEETKPKRLLGTGRKGLMTKSFEAGEGSNKEDFDVIFEVYEIERSVNKSKIGVLSQRTTKGKYTTETIRSQLKDLWDQAWVDDKDVEWLEESKELVREDKLNNILD